MDADQKPFLAANKPNEREFKKRNREKTILKNPEKGLREQKKIFRGFEANVTDSSAN